MVEWDEELLQRAGEIEAHITGHCAGMILTDGIAYVFGLMLARLERIERKLEAQSHE